MLLWLVTPCNGLYIRHFRNRRELEPKCVRDCFRDRYGERAVRGAGTRDEPLRTSAWEARNSPVSFGKLSASFFFLCP